MKRVWEYIRSIEFDIQLSQTIVTRYKIYLQLSSKPYRGSLFPGEFQNFERMPILTNGSLIENPITRIGENDVRMIPRPWESRDQVLSKVPSIRKLGNFGVGFGELFSESSVSKFYLSLRNCTIFVPASNNFPGSQIISIELLCVYRAKYPPSPQTCSNVTWIRNVTLLRLLEKRASFSTLPCSIARLSLARFHSSKLSGNVRLTDGE